MTGVFRFFPLGAVLLLLLAPAAAQSPVTEYLFVNLRQDVDDGNYLEGFLTWKAEVGGIVWSPTSDTEDPAVRAADATYNHRTGLGWTEYTNSGNDAGIPKDVFTSQPFPRTVFLNVSRVIQVNLYPKVANTNECPEVAFELYRGDDLIAGQISARLRMDYRYVPKAPAGHCVVLGRMHSEVDRLNEGDVLRLRILYREGPGPTKYGTQGDHASVIRLPLLPPEEAVFRIPELAASTEDAEAEPSPLLPFALLLLPAMARRRASLIPLMLVALAFSGCLGGGAGGGGPAGNEPTSGGRADATIVADPGLNLTDTGAILGQVSDEFRRAISAAHVSLLGTNHFTSTDRSGRFNFTGLAPATYGMRIDKGGFNSFEGPVKVVAGNVTRLDVMMEPVVKAKGGMRPHGHDDWAGETSKELFNGPVAFRFSDTGERGTCEGAHAQLSAPGKSVCRIDFRLRADGSDAPRVLPGTYDIEVSLSWPASSSVHNVGFGVRHNGNPNESLFYPRGRGETFHVRAAWGMSDPGHQQFSSWGFFFYVPTNIGRGTSSGCCSDKNVQETSTMSASAQIFESPVQVKMKIVKGVVPLEPGHPDHWNGLDEKVVVDGVTIANTKYCAKTGGVVPSQCSYPVYWLAWTPTQIVPPGTKELLITLEMDKAGQLEYPWGLLYRPANVRSGGITDFSQHKPLSPTPAGLKKEYTLPVGPAQTDPFYAVASNWNFAVDDNTADEAIIVDPVNFKLTVKAVRDPAFNATAA